MQVTYRDVDFDSDTDRALMLRWVNDPAIKHLYTRFMDAAGYATPLGEAYVQQMGAACVGAGANASLIVLVDDEPAGHATVEFDPPKVRTRLPNTAWIALMIGEADLRGRGLGKRIVTDLEGRAREGGAARIEVAVFGFNAPSLALFKGLGYAEVSRTPEQIYWDGRLWDDVRLVKPLR